MHPGKTVLTLIAISMACLTGCTSSGEKKQQRIVKSKGLPSELLVVVDKAIWTSDLSDSIRAVMEGAVPCLPQKENYFRMTHILTPFYKPTYSPGTDKRELVRELEAALRTLTAGKD